jgi:hypothetical protein
MVKYSNYVKNINYSIHQHFTCFYEDQFKQLYLVKKICLTIN